MASKSMGPRKKPMTPKVEVEKMTYRCPYCNQEKLRGGFYVSTDPLVLTGLTTMCKECAEKIARRYDAKTGLYAETTKESLCAALERLDKPFIEKLWESSYNEVHDPNLKQPKKSIWSGYIKNVTSFDDLKDSITGKYIPPEKLTDASGTIINPDGAGWACSMGAAGSGTAKDILFYDYETEQWYSIGSIDSSSVDPSYIVVKANADAAQNPVNPADVSQLKDNGFWFAAEKAVYAF